ncbi:hypothetical protein OCU04_011225 [Sclerotinia nivalis]|uniref:Uncharacterized protein n=1 Tax=Sclerotinia nivalis TaxID=352851 RepID=A0A9X0DE88_9HELO|nr:hypothetical protein OCU04_011225 [Sclerotinia nivalis]
MLFESLPNEILLEIMDALVGEAHRASLSRCSKHLYNIVISGLYSIFIATGIDMLKLFLRTITRNPDLAALVSSVDLRYFDDYSRKDDRNSDHIGARPGYVLYLAENSYKLAPSLKEASSLLLSAVEAKGPISKTATSLAMQHLSVWYLTQLSLSVLPQLKKALLPNLKDHLHPKVKKSIPGTMNMNDFFSIAYEPRQEYNDSVYGPFARRIATIQIDPDWQEGPMISLHNLFIKEADELKSMMQFFTLPSLRTFTMKYLRVSNNISRPIYPTNSTLLRLDIANCNIPSWYLVDFLKSLDLLETFAYEEPWPCYGVSDDNLVCFSDLFEGLSHLKHRLKRLRVFLGNHVQRSTDFSELHDFVALQEFEIGVSTLLSGTEDAMPPHLELQSGRIFPFALVLLRLNCSGIDAKVLESMLQPIQSLAREMKEHTPNLKIVHLRDFPGYKFHSSTSPSTYRVFESHPWLAKLSAECQANAITLTVA